VGRRLSGLRTSSRLHEILVQLRARTFEQRLLSIRVDANSCHQDLIELAGIFGNDLALRIDDEASFGMDEREPHTVLVCRTRIMMSLISPQPPQASTRMSWAPRRAGIGEVSWQTGGRTRSGLPSGPALLGTPETACASYQMVRRPPCGSSSNGR
jgi:hypothetical protein